MRLIVWSTDETGLVREDDAAALLVGLVDLGRRMIVQPVVPRRPVLERQQVPT